MLQNSAWPGAFAVGSGKRFVNVYVGYGLPAIKGRYAPAVPGAVADVFNVANEDAPFVERDDVRTDPNEGKAADAGDGDADADE